MKFLADVNIAQSVIIFLRGLGHEVLDGKEEHLLASDIEIIKIAQNDQLIILTRDKDFINLVQIPKYLVPIIVFRLRDQKPDNIVRYLKKILEEQKEEVLVKSLTIVQEESAEPKQLI